ncbi:MAG: hypothetical protein V4585_13500 [Bacteroidota bacterium]
MKDKNLNKLINYFLFSILICTILSTILIEKYVFSEMNSYLIAIGSLTLSSMLFSVSVQKLSINLIYSFFNFFFFYLIPLLQLNSSSFNYFIFGTDVIFLVEKSLMIIFYFNLFYYCNYYRKYFDNTIYSVRVVRNKLNISIIKWYSLFILIFTTYVVVFIGWQVFFFRSYFEEFLKRSSQIFILVYANYISPLTVFIFVIAHKMKIRIAKKNLFFLLIIAIIYNSPIAKPRFYIFTIFMVIYSVFFMKRERSGWIVLLYLAIGLFFSFYLSSLRYIDNIDDLSSVKLTINTSIFVKTIHFDAFEVLMMSVKYVQTKDFLYGENILGAILFFIPRVLWITKPITTGQLLLSKKINTLSLEDETFDNISCPLVAEIYISFGIIGIILIALLLGNMVAKFDLRFRQTTLFQKNQNTESEMIMIFLAISAGMILFILRGSLMTSIAYYVGIISAYYTALKLFGLKIIWNRNKKNSR